MTDDALKEIEGLDDLPKPIDVTIGGKEGGERKEGDGKERKAETGDAGKPPQEDENVVALRRSLAAEKQARETERRAREAAEAQLAAAEAQTSEGQLRHMKTSLDAARAAQERAQKDYRAALGASEPDAVVNAQIALNDAQYEVRHLTNGIADMERRAEAEKQEREQRAQRRPVPEDPVEAFASKLKPNAAAWVRNHPDCITDQRKNRMMVRAHEDAVDEGVEEDTPEYYAFIEKRLGIGHNDDEPGEQAQRRAADPPQRQSPRRQPPADAPVARSGAADGRGSRGTSVTLTPQMRKFCDENGMSYEDYARNYLIAKNDGRIQ